MNSINVIKQIAKIGDLNLLKTDIKDSTVLAINENVDKITSLQNELKGNKSTLETNVNLINELL